MYVQDASPANEASYYARFYFDPNSIVMAPNNAHYIFTARTGTIQVARWQLRYNKGVYQVQGQVRTNSGTYLSTAWFTISDAPHALELSWTAATTTTASDGSAQWWIDGVPRVTQSRLANGTLRVDDALLGPFSGIDSGTRGTEFFDAFESHRSSAIGL
jgi:hypothetical protein